MKILVQAHKFLAIYGIGSNRRPFNSRNLLAIFVFGMGIALCCVHLFSEVKTFEEYAESVFATITFITATTNCVYIMCEMRQFYDCFADAEKIINDREFE